MAVVLSGTRGVVPSGTAESCHQEPGWPANPQKSSRNRLPSNHANIMILTFSWRSSCCGQLDSRWDHLTNNLSCKAAIRTLYYDTVRASTPGCASGASAQPILVHTLATKPHLGALANIRGRHGVRHIPGSGDWRARLTGAVLCVGKHSCDLVHGPVSQGDAAPPQRNRVRPARSPARSLSRRSCGKGDPWRAAAVRTEGGPAAARASGLSFRRC